MPSFIFSFGLWGSQQKMREKKQRILAVALAVSLIFVFQHAFDPIPHVRNRVRSLLSIEGTAYESAEKERATRRDRVRQRMVNKMEAAITNFQADPGAGYPVVKPEKGQGDQIIRHVLIFNRLSPPNGLKVGQVSKRKAFFAWLNFAPGQGRAIRLTLKSDSVLFPPDAASFSRSNAFSFEDGRRELDVEWAGTVTIRNLQADIPLIVPPDAEPEAVLDFYVAGEGGECAFEPKPGPEGKYYEFKAFAKVCIVAAIFSFL